MDTPGVVTLEEIAEADALLAGNQHIADASDLRKYRIELPNLYDDAKMSVYEFRLLAHYKRVGNCTESTRTTATKCCMSTGKVSQARRMLQSNGFVEIAENEDGLTITVLDRWLENFQKYSEMSRKKGVHHMNATFTTRTRRSPGETKKEPIKNEPIKNGARQDLARAVAIFTEETGTPIPTAITESDRKENGALWWSPARRIIRQADGQSEELIRAACRRLLSHGMTVSNMRSIEKTVSALYGELHKQTDLTEKKVYR